MSILTLSITNLEQLQPGGTAQHHFDRKGGTIGSGAANWFVSDRGRTIAPIHCEIRWIEGSFCIIDHCNRTYLNDSICSLTSHSPRRLLEGDQLRIGAYRVQVYCLQDQGNARSLEELFNPDQRVLDLLIADVPTQAWRGNSPDSQAAAEICSVFEPSIEKDPLVALDAEAHTGGSQENPLRFLIAGAHP